MEGQEGPTVSEFESTPKIRMLQVEDEPIIRKLVSRNLDLFGVEHVTASTAMEAEEVFEKEKGNFNVLLTDFDMPGMNGAELIVALKKKNPELITVLFSGRAEGDEQVKSILGDMSYDYYFQKPVSGEVLGELLDELKQKLAQKKDEV